MKKTSENPEYEAFVPEVLSLEQRIAIDILDEFSSKSLEADKFEAVACEICGSSNLPSLKYLYKEAKLRAADTAQYGRICIYLMKERDRRLVTLRNTRFDESPLEEMKKLNRDFKNRINALNSLMADIERQRKTE